MDRHLSKNERKNMDACLRRLKQELLSMREAGDGLHAQMNSMMGALQELKLLQVQTALERLEISGRPPVRPTPAAAVAAETSAPPLAPEPQAQPCHPDPQEDPSPPALRPPPQEHPWRAGHRSSLGTSPSSSSLESEGLPAWRVSGYTAPQVDYCGPRLGYLPSECPLPQSQHHHHQQQYAPRHSRPSLDLPGILYSLSREGPSLDSEYSQDSMDESSDWTSSLMSRSRNRQPLVLGDNVFADLVGNWLDLPELEREEAGEEDLFEEERRGGGGGGGGERPDSPAHPLRLSRSQEICRRFSLTTNIFKKFLRSVRPDRDKLLKEKPGWMLPTADAPDAELLKRPRKAAKPKASFYLPFWASSPQGKGRPAAPTAEDQGLREPPHSGIFIDRRQAECLDKPLQSPYPRVYLDRRQPEAVERLQPLFDHNTAVWV
ncbi:PAK4-inhibitor INKA2-like [Alosa sapidissima]|uniref:PAK4-inhibitor INKA2-like n=1 Tax=Alosa sapidissima TaxID=34773 RepID=UPI001C09E2AC|nr:PAK4-inhibitor INKA2-like [Alosa sapidissima]